MQNEDTFSAIEDRVTKLNKLFDDPMVLNYVENLHKIMYFESLVLADMERKLMEGGIGRDELEEIVNKIYGESRSKVMEKLSAFFSGSVDSSKILSTVADDLSKIADLITLAVGGLLKSAADRRVNSEEDQIFEDNTQKEDA